MLTVKSSRVNMKGFAGDEREFFEKGIRKDRKPVPIHLQGWIDVNFLYVQIFLSITRPGT